MAPSEKDAAVQAALGPERFARVRASKLLVIGSGGIGCELLKDLVLVGFRNIEVVDLDTIDVSNLNRQFLFRKHHVDRPKGEVAAEAVRAFCPEARIVSHFGNIKESRFGSEFIGQFDVILNALDNLDARRHVNRLCLSAEKPLIEAGSTGYLGQVTVIKKGETECFECQAKPTQKVYPYCTIRSTPDKPVHCLIWAKNLFDLCFGPDDESNLLSDLSEEMKRLQGESTDVDGESLGKRIFSHLFDHDIKKQAALEDLWSEERPPPDALVFHQALKNTTTEENGSDKDKLESQKVPSIGGVAAGFVNAVKTMYGPSRKSSIGTCTFSKDDSVSMDFVHCAASLRMANYRIQRISRWDAQSIAGSIIPAIASTNAIVAGLQVAQLMHILDAQASGTKMRESAARGVWVRYPEASRKKILQSSRLQPPEPNCFVCGSSTARVVVKDFGAWKLNAFVKSVVQGALGAHKPAVYNGNCCIYDPEYPEPSEDAEEEGLHPDWTLKEWDLCSGCLVSVEDEGQGFSCNVLIREDEALDDETSPSGFVIEDKGEPEAGTQAADDSVAKSSAEVNGGSPTKRKADAELPESPEKKQKGASEQAVEIVDDE